ncbi:unnamed protein product [Lupinus luteus]|uniref:Polygalacturonase n=1 Tax=Lupinus luteus TaxID=3873 RepID=A0AAV1VXJ1_LUPLU
MVTTTTVEKGKSIFIKVEQIKIDTYVECLIGYETRSALFTTRNEQDHLFQHGVRNPIIGVISAILLLVTLRVKVVSCDEYPAMHCRKYSAFLTDFGGVCDGKTCNTKAFKYAISNLSQYECDGGALLVVPPGKWLSGSFNLTSHFTLFLQKDVVSLASQRVLVSRLSYNRFNV